VSHTHFYKTCVFKTCAAAVAAASLMMTFDMPQAFSATDQISGTTCRQLMGSCTRICVRRQGEPAYKGCMSDCANGSKACKTTGVWTSKNATIAIPKR
jgi:hypothetical protein